MLQIIFGLVCFALAGFILFVATAVILSFFPDWVRDAVGLGCGCLLVIVGIPLIVVVPILLVILALIGAFGG